MSTLRLGLFLISGQLFAVRIRFRIAQAYGFGAQPPQLKATVPTPPPPQLGGTGGTRPIYSDGQASFGSPRHHLLEGEAGLAERLDPDFLWLERSNAEGKISVLRVVTRVFHAPVREYYFDSVLA